MNGIHSQVSLNDLSSSLDTVARSTRVDREWHVVVATEQEKKELRKESTKKNKEERISAFNAPIASVKERIVVWETEQA